MSTETFIESSDRTDKEIERLMDGAGFTAERAREIVEGSVRHLQLGSIAVVDSMPVPTRQRRVGVNEAGLRLVRAVHEYTAREDIIALSGDDHRKAVDLFIDNYRNKTNQ